MAGHDDAQRVLAVGRADGASLVGIAELTSLLAVADRLAVRDRAQHHPCRLLERRAERIEWKIELAPSAGEVLLELGDGSVEQRRCGLR